MFDDEDKDEDDGDLFAAPTKPKTKEPEQVRGCPFTVNSAINPTLGFSDPPLTNFHLFLFLLEKLHK